MSSKEWNQKLHRLGLGVNRGLYMEMPAGIKPDGAARFQWGRKLSYRGGTSGRSPLVIASERFQLDPDFILSQFRSQRICLGEYTKKCQGCGEGFVATRSDAQCCSAKCRKRVSRKAGVTLIAR